MSEAPMTREEAIARYNLGRDYCDCFPCCNDDASNVTPWDGETRRLGCDAMRFGRLIEKARAESATTITEQARTIEEQEEKAQILENVISLAGITKPPGECVICEDHHLVPIVGGMCKQCAETKLAEARVSLCSECTTIREQAKYDQRIVCTSRDEGLQRERGLSKHIAEQARRLAELEELDADKTQWRLRAAKFEGRVVELEKAGQEYIELTDPMVQENETRRLRIVELEARNAELETEAERNRCIVRSYIHEVDLLKHALQSVRQFVPYPSLMLDRLDRALGPYVPKEPGQ